MNVIIYIDINMTVSLHKDDKDINDEVQIKHICFE